MEWVKPIYSRREVNWAASYLVQDFSGSPDIDPNKIDQAFDVVDNFRAVHAFPLNTLQNRLRKHVKNIDKRSIIAQRLKRFSSIWFKLRRFEQMKLWDMQDIGGCRAIVPDLNYVEHVVNTFKSSRIRHSLTHEDDYIQQPRDSGYRSRYLVYRYISDRNEIYNGLKVEVQIRTPIQHAWATTVETVDAFTQQALKSSMGKRDWERFFQLMGTEMALLEDTPPVPGTPTDSRELRQELKACADELQVLTTLARFRMALSVTRYQSAKGKNAAFFLLSLDNTAEHLRVTGYSRRESIEATKAYSNREKEIRNLKGRDTVLVSVDSIRNLQQAYPNYFADTAMFAHILKEALK